MFKLAIFSRLGRRRRCPLEGPGERGAKEGEESRLLIHAELGVVWGGERSALREMGPAGDGRFRSGQTVWSNQGQTRRARWPRNRWMVTR